jgi:hypothetical protein
MTVQPPLKVLFIAGCGRSGSTLLSATLGQVEGLVSVGELTNLWPWILEDRYPCMCGRRYHDCPFWGRVLEPDFADRPGVQEVAAVRRALFRQPSVRRRLRAANRRAFDEAADRYASILEEVYRRVQRVSGCDVIIDNSKQPAYGYAVGRVPDCEAYVLHLVRDSRAVAFSVQRHEGRSIPWIARYWMAVNLRIEYFWGVRRPRARYLRVRYEDFAAEPRRTIQRILRFVREDDPLDVFPDDRTVQLSRSNHRVEGYPSRFEAGVVEIRPDTKWSSLMPSRDRRKMTALTWPLLLFYGYPRASAEPSASEVVQEEREAS